MSRDVSWDQPLPQVRPAVRVYHATCPMCAQPYTFQRRLDLLATLTRWHVHLQTLLAQAIDYRNWGDRIDTE